MGDGKGRRDGSTGQRVARGSAGIGASCTVCVGVRAVCRVAVDGLARQDPRSDRRVRASTIPFAATLDGGGGPVQYGL